MASAMKFLYYSQKQPTKRTLSTRSMSNLEDFKVRFRRSGSLGIPFVPEEDLRVLKRELAIQEDEDEGITLFTVIVKTGRMKNALAETIAALPRMATVKHLETRESEKTENEMDLLVEMELHGNKTKVIALEEMRKNGLEVQEVSSTVAPSVQSKFIEPGTNDAITGAQWFPKSICELDICAKKVIMYGAGLDADHPGFKDEVYRKRRMIFADIALNYKHGQEIPRIEYTDSEKATWKTIYRTLRQLHLKYACQEFLNNFDQLEQYCGYSEDNVPQLEDISRFLKAKTGFRVRPVAGYLSARDFLAGLAFRVFFCTQYVRHSANPFYTPEPDTVHELMGHMALFADPDFAQFSQEIGLASLGASEDDLTKLARLYFFSIEFGLSHEGLSPEGKPLFRVYGAGLLSSAEELQHAIDDSPPVLPFDPDRVVEQECLITTFQSAYFFTRSFEEAQHKLRMFTSSMNRPFVVRYNAYTESVEVLNNKQSIVLAVNSLRSDINLLASALHYVL